MLKKRIARMETALDHYASQLLHKPSRRLRTPEDLLDLLQEQAAMIEQDYSMASVPKARALTALAAEARRIMETSHVEARLEKLQEILRARRSRIG
jgi:hypothetical protein